MVRNHFSEPIPNIKFIRDKSGNQKIPDRTYAIQKTGMFEFGLYQEIQQFLLENQITNIQLTDEFLERRDCGFEYEFYDDLVFKNRDYGVEAVKAALDKGYGTILSATGSGKSFLTASLLENLKRNKIFKRMKVLILVPGIGLVDQLNKDFASYKVSFTHSGWTGDIELENTEIVICNTENFCSKYKENKKWINSVDVLITDECHKAKNGNIVTDYIKKIDTPHKYGFTGTLPDTKIDAWKVIGTFGPIIFEKTSKELRDAGYLTKAKVKRVMLKHTFAGKMNYKSELDYIYNNKSRNEKICNLCEKLNNNTLVLVNHLEHGENITKALKANTNKEVYFVSGEMPVEERALIISKMEKQTNIVCVAMSSIFSTGINIKNLHYIMFIALGKSFIRTVQSIGRGLRLHELKDSLVIIDIYDDTKYSLAHAEVRCRIYDREQIPWKEVQITI